MCESLLGRRPFQGAGRSMYKEVAAGKDRQCLQKDKEFGAAEAQDLE